MLDTSIAVFIGLTVVLAGGAALLAGRAIATNWKPAWQVVMAAVGLTIADRFLVFALFGGSLLSPTGFLVHFVVVAAIGLIAWRTTQVGRLVQQYPWKYRRTSPFSLQQIGS